MSQHSYNNKFGSVTVSFENNLMVTQFTGAVSASLVEYLIKTSKLFFKNRIVEPWFYISSSKGVEATTPEGYELFIQAAQFFKQQGCIESAYILNSPIAIAQVKKLRDDLGVTVPLENVLFNDLAQAKQYAFEQLDKHTEQLK